MKIWGVAEVFAKIPRGGGGGHGSQVKFAGGPPMLSLFNFIKGSKLSGKIAWGSPYFGFYCIYINTNYPHPRVYLWSS
jgi:hypothetical protein